MSSRRTRSCPNKRCKSSNAPCRAFAHQAFESTPRATAPTLRTIGAHAPAAPHLCHACCRPPRPHPHSGGRKDASKGVFFIFPFNNNNLFHLRRGTPQRTMGMDWRGLAMKLHQNYTNKRARKLLHIQACDGVLWQRSPCPSAARLHHQRAYACARRGRFPRLS